MLIKLITGLDTASMVSVSKGSLGMMRLANVRAGDYVFGWKDNSLQRAMDSGCYLRNCTQLSAQLIKEKNLCTVPTTYKEELDECEF